MIVREKDLIYWELIFETKQEAAAIKDFLDRCLARGFDERAEQKETE